jgi:hypothetical protein
MCGRWMSARRNIIIDADDVPDSSAALRRTNKTAELLQQIDNATRSGDYRILISHALLIVK